jgi:hypothetical protein
MTAPKYWLEVLIVVIEGAGKKRDLVERGITTEMIWSYKQNLIMNHLKKAEEIWNVKIVHGKHVDKYWRDFIICGKTFFNDLHNILDPGNTLPDPMRNKLDEIWNYALKQTLTEPGQYATLIYTDADPSYYKSNIGKGKTAQPEVLGQTWFAKDKDKLSNNVSFIFSDANESTTAHELGHQVAGGQLGGLVDDEIRVIVMGQGTTVQKKKFYGGRYVHTDSLDSISKKQDYMRTLPHLPSPTLP